MKPIGEQRRFPKGKAEPLRSTPATGRRSPALGAWLVMVCGLMVWLAPSALMAQAVSNSATGTSGGAALNTAGATVNLNRIVVAGVPDPARSTVTVNPPVILADGTAVGTITVTLIDGNGVPVPGKTVTVSSDRGATDTIVQSVGPTDAQGRAVAAISSTTPGVVTLTVLDVDDSIVLSAQPQLVFTAGLVLRIQKTVLSDEVHIGDAVFYRIVIENTVNRPVDNIRIVDQAPPNFKYRSGSARLDGNPIPDPAGHPRQVFIIGTLGPNQKATLSYQMIVGSGANPGGEYKNSAVAKEDFPGLAPPLGGLVALAVCNLCVLSNTDAVSVKVVFDPIFDLGTIIGKVYRDLNRNGFQDRGEEGVGGVMVALDDGTYALTDPDGRYHFPAVRPGQRLVKINLGSLPNGAAATTREALVLEVTQGLLAKANFGVVFEQQTRSIGKEGRSGLEIKGQPESEPAKVIGSTASMTLVINGLLVQLPGAEVRMGVQDLNENVELKGGRLSQPIRFETVSDGENGVSDWKLMIYDPEGKPFHTIQGKGSPPPAIEWDGRTGKGELIQGGEVYQYSLEIRYKDGSRGVSSRRLFGVNRVSAISLNLAGSAFEVGRAELSAEAKKTLTQAAETLRKFPEEKVIIEGHTDATGSDEANLNLSKERVTAALDYLVKTEKIESDRFVVKWYGDSRPLMSNNLAEGREINRRVEIKGQVRNVEKTKILDQFRSKPEVRINGKAVPVGPDGRFTADVPVTGSEALNIEMKNEQGRKSRAVVALPNLTLLDPVGKKVVGAEALSAPSKSGGPSRLRYVVRGKTEPGNTVKADGRIVTVGKNGAFEFPTELILGRNVIGLVVRNTEDIVRVINLAVTVSDRDKDGNWLMVTEPVPSLEVHFPAEGQALRDPRLPVSGSTTPGNRVTVNGREAAVGDDGRFAAVVELPRGEKSPVKVAVTDPNGYTGSVEQTVDVLENDFFLLAFADGEVGRLQTRGYMDGAGQSKESDYYGQGRIAYYFKGTVLGKYLVTSAFDTGKRDFNQMFTDLDRKENNRLLTNLDPDKYYPVYGDSSTVVYDAESQGRFYLAVDSEEFHLLVGDFQVGMNQTELAAYNRTLYGGRIQAQSLSRSAGGAPNTQVTVFGAEVRTAHAHNEFRATGGALYYLSHDRVTEGSEQVRIEIRDQNTGVILSSIPQAQGLDYQVKYDEGRIFFARPIPSAADDTLNLIDRTLLGGNPVYIVADFEYQSGLFEDSAYGARVRQQIGDRLALGGTYVKDRQAGAEYTLEGGDAEVRIGKTGRILGEVARSVGTGGETQFSEDGGLTFTAINPGVDPTGTAYKISIEGDAGEPFGKTGILNLIGYFKELEQGFSSNGTILEQGTRKFGGGATLRAGRYDTVHLRYEGQRLLENGNVLSRSGLGGAASDLETAQWVHEQGRLRLTGEYQSRRLDLGTEVSRHQTAAARLQVRLTDPLTFSLEQQNTLEGPQNVQTTLGMDYAAGAHTVFGRAITGSQGEALRGGWTARVGRTGTVTVSQQFSRDPDGSRSSQSVIHGEERLAPETRIYSEYQLNRASGGGNDTSLAGLNHRWRVSEGLAFNFLMEGSRIDQDGAITTRDAFGAGLHYERPERLSISDRAEVRHDRGAVDKVQYLTSNAVQYRLGRDLRLLGKANASFTQNRNTEETEARYSELSAGMAYRPVKHDRFNGLAKYTLIQDLRPVPAGDLKKDVLLSVWSVEGILELNRFLQWVEKLAYKTKDETVEGDPRVKTHTLLSIHRLNAHLDRAWDIGLEYRLLRVIEAKDQRAGYLIEITREIGSHLRLGAGYNFTDFTDNEFSDNNYSVRGWFFRFQGKY